MPCHCCGSSSYYLLVMGAKRTLAKSFQCRGESRLCGAACLYMYMLCRAGRLRSRKVDVGVKDPTSDLDAIENVMLQYDQPAGSMMDITGT